MDKNDKKYQIIIISMETVKFNLAKHFNKYDINVTYAFKNIQPLILFFELKEVFIP